MDLQYLINVQENEAIVKISLLELGRHFCGPMLEAVILEFWLMSAKCDITTPSRFVGEQMRRIRSVALGC